MTGEWERTLAGQLVEAGLGRAEADGLARGAAEEARDASRDPQEPHGPAVAYAATLVRTLHVAETRELGANRGGGEVVMLALMAVQLLIDPDSSYAGLMPLWSTCELTGYAFDAPTANSLSNGLGHFAVTVVLCSLAAWGFGILRLRTRKFGPTPGFPGTSSR